MIYLKRLTIILLSYICFCNIVKAQQYDTFKQKYLLGLSAGTTYSRYIFTPSVRQHVLNGYWTGLIFRYDVESYSSLQLELNYSRSGWKERFDTTEDGKNNISKAYQREMDYIRMPILSYLHFNYSRMRIFVVAGPEFGWLLKEKWIEKGADKMQEWERQRHNMPTKHRLSWGLTGGLGFGINLGAGNRIEISGRYTYGFEDIWSTRRVDPYGKASETIIGARIDYLFTLN